MKYLSKSVQEQHSNFEEELTAIFVLAKENALGIVSTAVTEKWSFDELEKELDALLGVKPEQADT